MKLSLLSSLSGIFGVQKPRLKRRQLRNDVQDHNVQIHQSPLWQFPIHEHKLVNGRTRLFQIHRTRRPRRIPKTLHPTGSAQREEHENGQPSLGIENNCDARRSQEPRSTGKNTVEN